MAGEENIICFEEQRIRRALRRAEERLSYVRTLISKGNYELVTEAMGLEETIADMENALILLIEHDLDCFPEDPP